MWDDVKKFDVKLLDVEKEDFTVPKRFENFIIEAYDIEDAVKLLDKKLYENHVTGYRNDFTDNYNHGETECKVSYGDSEGGLQITYLISER